MIDITPIRVAMRKHLLAAKDPSRKLSVPISQIPKAYENQPFEAPNPPALWLRETWMPAVEKKVATGMARVEGIFQFDCVDGVGNGTEAVEALAKIIGDAFPASSAVTDNKGTQIVIVRTEKMTGGQGGGGGSSRGLLQDTERWFIIPVQTTIQAYEFIDD